MCKFVIFSLWSPLSLLKLPKIFGERKYDIGSSLNILRCSATVTSIVTTVLQHLRRPSLTLGDCPSGKIYRSLSRGDFMFLPFVFNPLWICSWVKLLPTKLAFYVNHLFLLFSLCLMTHWTQNITHLCDFLPFFFCTLSGLTLFGQQFAILVIYHEKNWLAFKRCS